MLTEWRRVGEGGKIEGKPFPTFQEKAHAFIAANAPHVVQNTPMPGDANYCTPDPRMHLVPGYCAPLRRGEPARSAPADPPQPQTEPNA